MDWTFLDEDHNSIIDYLNNNQLKQRIIFKFFKVPNEIINYIFSWSIKYAPVLIVELI